MTVPPAHRDPRRAFYTIGHSTRDLDAFAALLSQAGVDLLVDVRKMPRSWKNPQFNSDHLAVELASRGLGYVHIPALGGLRARQQHLGDSPNDGWRNASFRNYADYALTPPSKRPSPY